MLEILQNLKANFVFTYVITMTFCGSGISGIRTGISDSFIKIWDFVLKFISRNSYYMGLWFGPLRSRTIPRIPYVETRPHQFGQSVGKKVSREVVSLLKPLLREPLRLVNSSVRLTRRLGNSSDGNPINWVNASVGELVKRKCIGNAKYNWTCF